MGEGNRRRSRGRLHKERERGVGGALVALLAAAALESVVGAARADDPSSRRVSPDLSLEEPLFIRSSDASFEMRAREIDAVDLTSRTVGPLGAPGESRRHIAGSEETVRRGVLSLDLRSFFDGPWGVAVGRAVSTPLSKAGKNGSLFFVEKTPFQVVFKLGRLNALGWILRADDGSPVDGAKVTLYREEADDLELYPLVLDEGTTDGDGLVELRGLSSIDPSSSLAWAFADGAEILKVRVERGDEGALLPLVAPMEAGASPSNRAGPSGSDRHPLKGWAIAAAERFAPGARVKYKLFARLSQREGADFPPRAGYTIEVRDPTGLRKHREDSVVLSPFGTYEGEIQIPLDARPGPYEITLAANYLPAAPGRERQARTEAVGRFVVAPTGGPPLRVVVHAAPDLVSAGGKLEIETVAESSEGILERDAVVRQSVRLQCGPIPTLDAKFSQFNFDLCPREGSSKSAVVHQVEGKLDSDGKRRERVTLDDLSVPFGEILVTTEAVSASGQAARSETKALFAGRDRFIGVKFDKWSYKLGSPVAVELVVVDNQGRALPGAKGGAAILREEQEAGPDGGEARFVEVKSCSFTSTNAPFKCVFTPLHPGRSEVRAKVLDGARLPHTARASAYVLGWGDVPWSGSSRPTLEILPDRTSYRVGETARFLVKNPWKEARGLITLERDGTMKEWVSNFSTPFPIVEVPVTRELVPGFHMSVTAVSRGRATGGAAEAGKARVGYASVVVDEPRMLEAFSLSIPPGGFRSGREASFQLASALDEDAEALVALFASPDPLRFHPRNVFEEIAPLALRTFVLIGERSARRPLEDPLFRKPGEFGADHPFAEKLVFWEPAVRFGKGDKRSFRPKLPETFNGGRIVALVTSRTLRPTFIEWEVRNGK